MVRPPEEVYALFVEANPVANPDVLVEGDGDLPSAALHLVEGDDGGDGTAPRVMPFERRRRWGWRPATAAAVIVLVVAAAGYGVVRALDQSGTAVAAQDAVMHLVFDGEACTYSGPSRVVAGHGVLTGDRLASAEPVALLATRLTDGSITLADIDAWAAVNSAQVVPPFVESPLTAAILTEGATSGALPVRLRAGRYVLTCNTAPEGTDRAFPAAILTVVDR